jgi:hypothetical protein
MSEKRNKKPINILCWYYGGCDCAVYTPIRPDGDYSKEKSYKRLSTARRLAKQWYGYSKVGYEQK